MDERVTVVLAEYSARQAAERVLFETLPSDEIIRQLDEFLISVGDVVGRFLNDLVKAQRAQTILELGTSHGFSTLWLAEAARETGGRVITTELSPRKIAYARAMAERAGLADQIDFRQGDARETIGVLAGPIDFVLVDLWKDLYIPCFDLFYPKLAPGALVVADNMIVPEEARADAFAYRRHVQAHADIDSVLLPLGQGIEVSRCTRGLDTLGIAAA